MSDIWAGLNDQIRMMKPFMDSISTEPTEPEMQAISDQKKLFDAAEVLRAYGHGSLADRVEVMAGGV